MKMGMEIVDENWSLDLQIHVFVLVKFVLNQLVSLETFLMSKYSEISCASLASSDLY